MNRDSNSPFHGYAQRLAHLLSNRDWTDVMDLAQAVRTCWEEDRQLFLCGNGGSAANALHLANDYLYGVGKGEIPGLRVQALSANPAVITCLANDVSYDRVYAEQLTVQARPGDLLLVFSGSGNSPNCIEVLKQARSMGVTSYAVLGFQGGACKSLADGVILFPIEDMQISEDCQIIVGHMLMQWLSHNPPIQHQGSIYVEASCSW